MPLPPPYPHQSRAIADVKAAYRAGARRICVVLPTGGGKTRLGMGVVEGAMSKGRRLLWVAHREELIDQASESLRELGQDHGIIKAGRVASPSMPVQVASVQTLTARPGSLPPADIIVADECHHNTCDTHRDMLAHYPRPELVLGLTATPQRGDGAPLGDIYEALVVGATIAELQAARRPDGHTVLVPCRTVRPPAAQQELAERPIQALLKLGRRRDGSIRPTILFAASVRESIEHVAEARAAGLRAMHVDGKTAPAERKLALDMFRRGELDLVSNVFVLTEGFDAPITECILLARGCGNHGTFLQMVGRGLRSSPSTGKVDCLIIDLCGVVHQHGLPEWGCTYSLTGKAISKGEDAARVQQCGACGACFKPAEFCPACGKHLGKPRAKKKVKPADLAEHAIEPLHKRQEFLERLIGEAKSKGYKAGWVGMRFKARFGFWPQFGRW